MSHVGCSRTGCVVVSLYFKNLHRYTLGHELRRLCCKLWLRILWGIGDGKIYIPVSYFALPKDNLSAEPHAKEQIIQDTKNKYSQENQLINMIWVPLVFVDKQWDLWIHIFKANSLLCLVRLRAIVENSCSNTFEFDNVNRVSIYFCTYSFKCTFYPLTRVKLAKNSLVIAAQL